MDGAIYYRTAGMEQRSDVITFLYKAILHFKCQIRQENDIIVIMTNSFHNSLFKNDYEFMDCYAIEKNGISYTGMKAKKL